MKKTLSVCAIKHSQHNTAGSAEDNKHARFQGTRFLLFNLNWQDKNKQYTKARRTGGVITTLKRRHGSSPALPLSPSLLYFMMKKYFVFLFFGECLFWLCVVNINHA